MQLRPSLLGALVGAVLGGIGRGALAAFYLRELNRDTTLVVLVVAAIGVVVGALSGLTGRPVWGAVVGAALTAVVYLATLPAALFMQAIQVGRAPSLVEVLGSARSSELSPAPPNMSRGGAGQSGSGSPEGHWPPRRGMTFHFHRTTTGRLVRVAPSFATLPPCRPLERGRRT